MAMQKRAHMGLGRDIIDKRLQWLELRRREGVDGLFRATALALPMPPSLHDALLVPRGDRAVIARVSREDYVGRGGDPKGLASMVERLTEMGVSALMVSVGTDVDGVGFEDILCAAQTTHLPIICSDIVLDPLQVTLARAHGAAAVVLAPGILDDRAFRALRRAASDMSLETVLDISRVSQVESVTRGRSGQQSGSECRVWSADLLGTNGENAGPFRERFGAVLPEFSMGLVPVDVDATADEIDGLSSLPQVVPVIDVSTPELARVEERVGRLVGALAVGGV